MAAIRSLKPAISSLVRNPIIIVVAAVVGLLQLPQLLVPTTSPLLATAVSVGVSGLLLFVLPFYQGGIIGMADDARTGTTSIGTLIDAGKSNYVSLLLSSVVVVAIAIAFGVVVAIGAVVGGVVEHDLVGVKLDAHHHPEIATEHEQTDEADDREDRRARLATAGDDPDATDNRTDGDDDPEGDSDGNDHHR